MHSDTFLINASSKDRYILSVCNNCMQYRCTEVKYALVFEKQRRMSLGMNYRYSRRVLMSCASGTFEDLILGRSYKVQAYSSPA